MKTISQTLPTLSSAVQIYGIYIEDQDKVIKSVRENNLKFPILIDNGAKIYRALKLKYFPTKLLLDNGTITKTWFGSSPDEASLLKELNIGG